MQLGTTIVQTVVKKVLAPRLDQLTQRQKLTDHSLCVCSQTMHVDCKQISIAKPACDDFKGLRLLAIIVSTNAMPTVEKQKKV